MLVNRLLKRALIFLAFQWLLIHLIHPFTIYGFMPPQEGSQTNIKRSRFYSSGARILRKKDLYSQSGIDDGALERTLGPEWKSFINYYTNLPSRIFGGRVKLSGTHRYLYRNDSISNEELIVACKDFIDHHHALFKIDAENLRIIDIKNKRWIYFVYFQQMYQEKAIYSSYLTFIIDSELNIVSINMNIFPDIDIPGIVEVDEASCYTLINNDLSNKKEGIIEFIKQEEVVYPIVDDSGLSFCWALCCEIKIPNPLQRLRYYIDVQKLRILEKIDLAHYMVSGRITGRILPEYYDDREVEVALPDLRINLLRLDSPLYFNPFDNDPHWEGIDSESGWEFGKPLYRNDTEAGPDPSSGHTGMTIYGYNLSGPYSLGIKNSQYLTMSQSIDCSGTEKVGLIFWRWLGVKGSLEDRATVEVWDNAKESWQDIWENEKENLYDGEWRLIFYDISNWASGNSDVRVRWGMGPTNEYISGCGWNIDDVGLYKIIHAYSDRTGNFEFHGEDTRNMLIGVLEGRYFRVKNNDGANITYSQYVSGDSQDRSVHFTRMSTYDQSNDKGVINALLDIDEINVYFHATKMINYIQDIDPNFLSLYNRSFLPINITVRYDERYNNAFWLSGEGIFFGEGDGFQFRNFAHFSDIIYHEVTHAITDIIYGNMQGKNTAFSLPDQNRMFKGFDQFDAMHEAFSDYWACTLNDDNKIADGGFWRFANDDCIRNLENDLHFFDDYGYELYESSLILSGAMWHVRHQLIEKYDNHGVRIADTLFHFAREAKATTFKDFLLDVLLIDEIRYDSEHKELILECFGEKGIGLPPSPPSSLRLLKTEEGIHISWIKNPDAMGYCIYYRTEQDLPLNKENEQTNRNDYYNGRRVDVGDRDSYLLGSLSSGDYIIKVTSYNKYGVESASFIEKRIIIDDGQFLESKNGIQDLCFIGII